MQPVIIDHLLQLNEQFYQTFALQFAQTRQRLQPGVRQLLPRLAGSSSLLDLGCGSGELARQLAGSGYRGLYTGLDFSPNLLKIARQGLPADFQAFFIQANLVREGWEISLPRSNYHTSIAFAVLHHIPGQGVRLSFLQRIRQLLLPGGLFYCSNWQFLRSPRLRARIQPWARLHFADSDVDPGDYLLDWRQGGSGLRYVHQFTLHELADLAAQAGFLVSESFDSDGKTSDLSLYQVWQAV
jgi:SAM-dependent methyltransferase